MFLACNCPSINYASTMRTLKALPRVHKLDCIFLCKTKVMNQTINDISYMLRLDNWFTIKPRGSKGHLVLLLNSRMDI